MGAMSFISGNNVLPDEILALQASLGGKQDTLPTLGIGYLQLGTGLTQAEIGGLPVELGSTNWVSGAGFTNTLTKVAGGGAGFALLAGKTYEIEAHLYGENMTDGAYLFAQFRNRAAIGSVLPASVTGGLSFQNKLAVFPVNARDEMSGVVKCFVSPSANMDCVLVVTGVLGAFLLPPASATRANCILCKEIR